MLGGRGSSIALAAGILLHLLFVASLFGQFLNPLFLEAEHCPGQAADYFGIWQAGDNLLHGVSIYDSQDWKNEAVRRVPYFYFYRYLPPTAYVAAVGAWLLDPWTSYVLWAALIEALLVAIVVWILRMRAFPLAERRWQAAVWLGFTPFYLEQWMGQFSFLMAALLWIVLRPTLPDRPRQAREDTPRGAAFVSWAASIAIKSYPALFALPYLRRGRWRPVALCAAAVVLVSAPYYLARPDDVGQFLRLNFHGLPPRILGGSLGASALVRFLGWTMPSEFASKLLVLGPGDIFVGNVPVAIWNLLVAIPAAWMTWKRGREAPLRQLLCLWVLAFFLVFKDVWEYHYVMLLPALTVLALGERSRFVLAMSILLALPTPYALVAGHDGSLSWLGSLLQHLSKPLPAIALYVWLLLRLRRPEEEAGWETPEGARLGGKTSGGGV